MEKRFSTHSGNTASKRNSVERGTPARRPGRSGSHSPGSGAAARVGGSNGAMPGARGPLSQSHKHHLEGVLNKYTNLLQGWQNRYFVLDPELGQLQYFLNEQSKTQRPRGSLPLIGASVAPGDEFPHMFTVSAATGEVFKLRAADQRELQLWMMQLQLCARRHSDSSAKVMSQAEGQQKTLVQSIEALPARGPFSALDQDLLLLKATSAATISCLGECFSILQHNVSQAAQHLTHTPHTGPKAPAMDHARNGGLTTLANSTSTPPSTPANRSSHTAKRVGIEVVDPGEETTDTEDNEEEDLGVLDDQRSVILHLLSQLKLGMDLTRVVLPTFILERRSLLEMYANFMAHPDMFLAVTTATTPEERIVRFVEYYLTAFHEGRRGAVAKKPYNPILGETFCCSWDVPRDRVRPLRPTGSSPAPPLPGGAGRRAEGSEGGGGSYQVRFVAEQVSHHPPVSGFYCECLERKVCVNTHVWTKSKFMGMSIGVSMVGEGVLYLLEHGEEYVFTLPCAYARSILTVPWVELGGKVSISCAKSGYSATITFHTKPFYGGKVHRVTAEVKQNSTGTIVCKAQGEWNGTLEFTYSSGETKVIDTCKLPVIKKKIRPIDKQGPFESRRLWQHVTSALKAGDMDAATGQKHRLEERQRSDERQRGATNTAWEPKYFSKEDDGWVYHNPLWKTH